MGRGPFAETGHWFEFTAKNGITFRVVDEGETVSFYDTRYDFTRHGQFTGARYYKETLITDKDVLGRFGLNLHGGVTDWKVDAQSMQAVFAWLAGKDY